MSTYHGTVLSYNGNKGYGFIQSDQVAGDVFFGKQSLPAELLQAGDFFQLRGKTICFDLSPQDYNGKPVAAKVSLITQEGEQHIGTIKSYNPTKGYGFIGSSGGQQDYWFGRRDLPPAFQDVAAPGQVFSFVPSVSPDGKHQAKNLLAKDGQGGAYPPQMMAQPQGAFYNPGYYQPQMQQMPMPHQQQRQPQMIPRMQQPQFAPMPMQQRPPVFTRPGNPAAAPPQMAGQQQQQGRPTQGVVKTYDANRGFGFCTAHGMAEDLYFKGQGMHFEPGETISFWIKIMPDGKAQARSVQKAVSLEEGVFRAKVTSYSSRNGYGFMTITEPAGHPDVYFKKDVIPEEYREAEIKGMEADIAIVLTPDGKPQCKQMTLAGHGAAPMAEPANEFENMLLSSEWDAGVDALAGGLDAPPAKRPRVATASPAQVSGGELAGYQPARGGASQERDMTDAEGVVTSYSAVKGFGFISSPNSTEDVFFSKKLLPIEWSEQPLQGMKVAFKLSYTPDGKPQGQGLRMAC